MMVLDASMALAWLLPRLDATEAALAETLLDEMDREEFLVPPVWYAEISNALLRAERKGVISSDQATGFVAQLAAAGIEVDSQHPKLRQPAVMALAHAHGLTAYDAIYLELALRFNISLATFDQKLAEAMRKAGGRIFGDISQAP